MSNGPSILLVEDDRNLARVFMLALEAEGYRTIDAGTGRGAMEEIRTRNPDLILLDLGLPDSDGPTLVPIIRAHSAAPIIVVSGRGDAAEKVRALDAGADDYVTKPFSVPEILARVRAVLRTHSRVGDAAETAVSFGAHRLDFAARRLMRGETEIHLTRTEFGLLATLARHADRVVTTDTLLKETWGTAYQRKIGYIRVYVHALRQKVEVDPTNPKHILNAAGLGYRLRTSHI